MLRPLDPAERRRHKLRNTVQTWLLAAASLALLAVSAYALAGRTGVVWALILGGASLVFGAQVSPAMVLRLYRARPISSRDAPELVAVVAELARRAGLPAVPRLFYVPSRLMNAFAVGRPDEAAIAVTDGLIRGLTLRQIAGVLAHEISHVRNGDLRVMVLADTVSRMTAFMSSFGLFLFLLNLPLLLLSGMAVPWIGALLLMAAPTMSGLIQLAMYRAREFDADLDAAGFTGDPEGLASALMTLERRQGALWERLVLPGPRIPDPSLLRTHPKTEDRVRKLLSLRGAEAVFPRLGDERPAAAETFAPVMRPPRIRISGVWY